MAAVVCAPSGVPAHLADCPGGEESDIYTSQCVPSLVPNSPATPVNVTAPAVTSCPAGVSGAECAGTAQGSSGPQTPPPVPQSPEQELENVSTPGV